MRYLVIGDIHGEIDKLLKFLPFFNKVDKVIFVGDYIDRGNNSLEVLREVLTVPNAICLMGNHEYSYKKKINRGKVVYPKDINIKDFGEFSSLINSIKQINYKDENIAVTHAAAALWQHNFYDIDFDKFIYGWTDPTRKNANGYPIRKSLAEVYPNEKSEKPIIYGHTHEKQLLISENVYCVDFDSGNEGGQLCGVIFENSKLVDTLIF